MSMAKVINLGKDENIEQLRKKLQRAKKNINGINTERYSGTITLKEDPLVFQKNMRNEWS